MKKENNVKLKTNLCEMPMGYWRGILALCLISHDIPFILEARVKALTTQMVDIKASFPCVSKISLGQFEN